MPEASFRIVGIDILGKGFVPKPTKEFKGEIFSFDMRVDVEVIPDNKHLIQHIRIGIREKDIDTVLANFVISFVYEVVNFDEVIQEAEKGIFNISTDLDLLTRSNALSTSRGIIWSELRGTYLHHAIVPVIDATSFTQHKKE